jgi:hypothetical protein
MVMEAIIPWQILLQKKINEIKKNILLTIKLLNERKLIQVRTYLEKKMII